MSNLLMDEFVMIRRNVRDAAKRWKEWIGLKSHAQESRHRVCVEEESSSRFCSLPRLFSFPRSLFRKKRVVNNCVCEPSVLKWLHLWLQRDFQTIMILRKN